MGLPMGNPGFAVHQLNSKVCGIFTTHTQALLSTPIQDRNGNSRGGRRSTKRGCTKPTPLIINLYMCTSVVIYFYNYWQACVNGVIHAIYFSANHHDMIKKHMLSPVGKEETSI